MNAIYDVETYDQRSNVGHLLGRVKAELMIGFDQELAKHPELAELEVSSAQFSILSALSLGLADSASQLCKGIQYDAGAMTRMIDRLEAKGLIRRSRSEADRRLVNLELTEAGHAAVPKLREVAVAVLNRYLQDFSKAEVDQLEGFLRRMLEHG
jgi:DNA-binding MarR family transcriptional regulator